MKRKNKAPYSVLAKEKKIKSKSADLSKKKKACDEQLEKAIRNLPSVVASLSEGNKNS